MAGHSPGRQCDECEGFCLVASPDVDTYRRVRALMRRRDVLELALRGIEEQLREAAELPGDGYMRALDDEFAELAAAMEKRQAERVARCQP